MQCNKNPNYSLKETELDSYHLLLTFKIHRAKEKVYEEQKRKVIVSKKDFQQMRKPESQSACGWTELVILHDPTIKPVPIETDDLALKPGKPLKKTK